MCGIAGGIGLTYEQALHMRRALRHRGPDGEGVERLLSPEGSPWGEGWLVHTRLAVIDLSEAAHQPMTDAETGNWIAFNGEVYNHRELRGRLESEGQRFTTRSDTEVILKAYARWGTGCLEHLSGMFAFALWNARSRSLLLARDRMGIKPLYLRHDRSTGAVLFASELRAMLASGLVDSSLSLGAMCSYLETGSVEDPLTMIEGVSALLPGHYALWREGRLETHEYWDIPLSADGVKRDAGDLEAALAGAAKRHLASDVPVSVFLSGGVDSGALLSLLGEEAQATHAFTVGFDVARYDESPLAHEVARAFGVGHTTIRLSQEDVRSSLDAAVQAYDQPSVDGVNTFVIARAVREAGYKVALSGLGADEVFAGYPGARQVPRLERAERWLGLAPGVVRRGLGRALKPKAGSPDGALKAAAWLAGTDPGEWPHPYFMTRALFTPPQAIDLLTPEARHQLEAARPHASALERRSALVRRAAGVDPVNRYLYLEARSYLANTLLRDADAMSMAHGLEVRVPYLDHHLVERMASIAGSAKLRRGVPKPLLTGALARSLPEAVVRRPKGGFTLPWEEWLRGPLGERVRETIAGPGSALGDVLDQRSTAAVWEGFLAGSHSWSRPWSLFMLAAWAEANLKAVPRTLERAA